MKTIVRLGGGHFRITL